MFDQARLSRSTPILCLVLSLLAACGSQPSPASLVATSAALPTSAPAEPTAATTSAATAAVLPTLAVAESQTPAATSTGAAQAGGGLDAIPESLTPEGYHLLGRPDAPVTLVMY